MFLLSSPEAVEEALCGRNLEAGNAWVVALVVLVLVVVALVVVDLVVVALVVAFHGLWWFL